ncbi:hypothetical protein JCM19241_2619 [Vibrio ishigakensis]|uniref:DUF1853 family protein n=1 Tax=Vibrio ishigakensis TaxID=1481914 RepID=A0A0B8QET9_9VIBR|nr:hypothetical protein JCM19241_2619 [Vibrio ishigakensis]
MVKLPLCATLQVNQTIEITSKHVPLLTPETLTRFANWIQNRPNLMCGDEPIAEQAPFSSEKLSNTHDYQGNSRLGFIYQDIWHRLFEQSGDFDIRESELQLFDEKKTIGELDFILKNQSSGEYEHWEVAIKFYLLKDGLWYGPNAIDRLDKKFKHMLERQLQHGQQPYFKALYPEYQNLTPKLMMQGRLYTNPFSNEEIPTQCEGYPIKASEVAGFWCYHHQLKQIGETLYRVPKPLWLLV